MAACGWRQQPCRECHPSLCGRQEELAVFRQCRRRPCQRSPLQPDRDGQGQQARTLLVPVPRLRAAVNGNKRGGPVGTAAAIHRPPLGRSQHARMIGRFTWRLLCFCSAILRSITTASRGLVLNSTSGGSLHFSRLSLYSFENQCSGI